MLANLALALLTVFTCCDICAPIKVPVVWDSDSEVKQNNPDERDEFSVEQFKPKNVQQNPIPTEYFQYTAKKPQFAVDIAAFHGVQSPENYYKSYPVRPYTGVEKPELGKHRIQEERRPLFHNFQEYINQNEQPGLHITPTSSNYEVFHPYKAEEPGLQALYKDPVLDKIRHDIRESSQRLQKHENEAGKPEIDSDEYLESLDQTDRKKIPHRNIPTPYEIHKPQRRPVYYRPVPKYSNREHILNQRFKHPWNQNFVKIRPVHYRPLKHHLHSLRQHHALTFDDEHNEYPQTPVPQHYEEPPDGYDIYSRGKEKYVQLRNNLDESVNNLVREHRPVVPQRLELQQDEKSNYDENEEEFIPIKNYAQVRKIETTKHVPKEAAFEEAETYEEIKNAPRLKQAIKSTKAQTVYTEEGYEDSAYDHAGEQKHASDHEGHGGFLQENELSGGKYKAPSLSAKYEDGNGSAYRDQKIHAEKWKDHNKDTQQEEESEDYSEDGQEHSAEADSYDDGPTKKLDNQRNKREKESDEISEQKDDINDENLQNDTGIINESQSSEDVFDGDNGKNATVQHDVNKREASFKVPDINLNSTFLNEHEILEIAKEKLLSKNNLKTKYPYYFKNLETINKDSPLRYAENLKLMPKKSKGGTEFYDSRSQLECLEVDDNVDAIPEKIKNGHLDDQQSRGNSKNDTNNVQPRLQGLGNKIDCFKAKYFGENPLDSPFFQEDLISNPEPVTAPNLPIFKLKTTKDTLLAESANNITTIKKEIDKIKLESESDEDNLNKFAQKNRNIKLKTDNETIKNISETHSDVYTGVIQTIKDHINPTTNNKTSTEVTAYLQGNKSDILPISHTVPYTFFKNIDDVIKSLIHIRLRRSASFVYEPYKIIRDIQNPDTKKTTTTSNISPLIKQLQASKVIDVVLKPNQDKEKLIKRNVQSRTYKDIGKKEREKSQSIEVGSSDSSFVDVSVDQRRGEPRYELRPSNHKHQYSPVENKKAMSLEDYETYAKKSLNHKITDSTQSLTPQSRRYNLNSTSNNKAQNLAASNTVEKTVTNSPNTKQMKEIQASSEESDEDYDEEYDEYDEEDENEEEAITSSTTTSTTTTTTPKAVIRRRIRSTTTTEKPVSEDFKDQPKLRLVTRFRNSPHYDEQKTVQPESHSHKVSIKLEENDDSPKYREKKKKSSKSTLVTDTKKYGEDNDDMRKEEIDALIGVQHDMDEYIPLYEKEAEQQHKKYAKKTSDKEVNVESDGGYDNENDDEDEDDYESEEDYDDESDKTESEQDIPTTENLESTLIMTTDAPQPTTEVKSMKLQTKPRIIKKKIEIHKELPVNKSSPHVTQFKQDIKEVEIIKEIPRKNTPQKMFHKNLEVLDLYKDDSLAKDINKLGAVEIFKEDLDLKRGPKHGGNYKRAPQLEDTTLIHKTTLNRGKGLKDAEVSQTENQKLIELDDDIPARTMHGGNLKSSNDIKRFKNNVSNAKLIDLSELSGQPEKKMLHGGNLKTTNYKQRRRGSKSEKLIELNDDSAEDQNDSAGHMHGGNYKSYPRSKSSGRGSTPDGNHRNAKLVRDESVEDEDNTSLKNVKGDTSKDVRSKSAVLLNSFAQVVPILTTTPTYILDPSKRMYYYVDA